VTHYEVSLSPLGAVGLWTAKAAEGLTTRRTVREFVQGHEDQQVFAKILDLPNVSRVPIQANIYACNALGCSATSISGSTNETAGQLELFKEGNCAADSLGWWTGIRSPVQCDVGRKYMGGKWLKSQTGQNSYFQSLGCHFDGANVNKSFADSEANENSAVPCEKTDTISCLCAVAKLCSKRNSSDHECICGNSLCTTGLTGLYCIETIIQGEPPTCARSCPTGTYPDPTGKTCVAKQRDAIVAPRHFSELVITSNPTSIANIHEQPPSDEFSVTNTGSQILPSSVALYVHTVGVKNQRMVGCFIANPLVLRFVDGGGGNISGAEVDAETSISVKLRIRPSLTAHTLVAALEGVGDRDNTISRREGLVVCHDLTPDEPLLLSNASFALTVNNVIFPYYTQAAIHRDADNSRVSAVLPSELTTVGRQNVTFFLRDASWIGAVFSGTTKLQFHAEKSGAGALLGQSAPLEIALADGRSATFLLPTFEEICASPLFECPGRVWTSMVDTVTGGAFHAQMFYTELCHDSQAWPDPTTEPELCLSFDPEVASQCAFGFGASCQDCPRHARCPGGNRAWPMPGFWNEDESSLEVIRCAVPSLERCPLGFDTKNLTCTCGEGYAGYACRECAPGYFQARDLRCAKCPETVSTYESIVLPSILIVVFLTSIVLGLTMLTLSVILVGIACVSLKKLKVAVRLSNLRKWAGIAAHGSFLFGLGLVCLLQVISSVVRPVPLNAPTWYTATISILDVVFLDTGGFVNSACLNGDVFASERAVLVGTLACLFFVTVLQVKSLRPENLCFCERCCEDCPRLTVFELQDKIRSTVTPGTRKLLYFAINFLYGVAAATALSMVTCVKGVGGAGRNSALYLRSRPDLECYSVKDGTLTLSIMSWITLTLFTLPYPIVTVFWVRRYFWRGSRGRGRRTARRKSLVYDYWVAPDGYLEPRYFWFRSLDAALLSATALLTAVFGKVTSISEQTALLVLTWIVMLSFMVLILRLQPFRAEFSWARDFRIATLSVASLAATLRFCDSAAVGTDDSQIAVLAGIILVLLVCALAVAVIEFEYQMLLRTRQSIEEAVAHERSKKELLKRFSSKGITMNQRADKKFIRKVRKSFELNDNPLPLSKIMTENTVVENELYSAPAENRAVEYQLYSSQPQEGWAAVVNPMAAGQKINVDLLWEEIVDDVTGHSYFVNSVTGESLWEKPEVDTGTEDGQMRTRSGRNDSDDHDPDASQWEEVVDEVSGHVYFVNVITGDSQWTKPVGFSSGKSSFRNRMQVPRGVPPLNKESFVTKASTTMELRRIRAARIQIVTPINGRKLSTKSRGICFTRI
jgi:hypothetical protein